METFAVFGGAFLMRPLGGVLFGYMGDRVGRRRALVRQPPPPRGT
jgi:MFS transporter, MHS family, proline/betaine transporter